MFPAAQKTFKTKQKYSTNNNLGKRLHFFFDKNKTLSIIILASLILCLLSFTFLHLRRVQPNSNIRSLASHSKAILENKNPNFNVFFGERNTPDKQWVRFEAKASSENPFEESQKGFFGQILDTVRPKRVLGIEFSLEQAGTEKVKTSTEFIENVEPKEGDNPYTSSQKPHVLNTDVVDGIDIEYQILEGLGLKEDIIIKDLDLYTKECEDITTCDLAFNEFVFNLKLDDGLILKRAWYTYKGKNTETYYFTDEKGNYIGHFLPSWAIDSNGVKTHHIDIKVEEEKGNLKVKVVIDNDWLFSEERIFPIRIDPTIVHDTEIDFGAGSFVNTEIRNGPELGLKKPKNKLIDSNTVGYWTLDETGGSGAYLLDSSGNNNHGTPTGTTYTSGKIGGARGFNGSSDYITLGNPTELQITGNQTISMWLKPSNFSDRRNPYAKCFGGEGSIVQETNGTLTYYYGTAGSNASPYQGLSSNQSLTLNQWNHIAIVRDFTNMKLYWYINGNLTNSATTTYTYAASSTLPAYIASGNRSRYAGVIDDVRIDNVARTAEEIRQIYEMGRRTHPIVVTFNANLKSTNLITGDDDLSFDITTDSIENIDKGEKIIIKENYNGTEYIAQGNIETINKSTGAITVSSWDSGSTSPHYGIHSIGFSTNATVFKWQKEYIDIRFPLPEDKNNISQLTFRKTTNEGTTFWIDNMKKAKYLTDSSGSTFEEVKNIQEAQYKSIFTTWDKNVSSDFYLTSVTLDYNDNNPPTAPTNLLTQGQTNPIRISTPTPYFSAIFNDPDTGDTGTKYQIQVNNSSDFSGGLTWDSGINIMTATSVGARSPNLTYAGTALPMDGTTYYWRIKFIDYGGLESPWSSTAQFTMNRPPTAPTDLLTQGQTNPIRISTPTPYFSAIFNDLDTGDTGVKYQIQVNTTGNFSGALIWDSGIKTMTATSVGARSPNITYAGAALPMDGTIYYWRIKFVDYGGLESLWSSIAQFTMNNSPSVPTDLLTQGQTNPLKVTTPTPYFSAIFNDPDTGDTGIKYQIQVNVQDNFQPISMIWDSGIKTMTATSVGARSPNITYAGTTLPMDGTKYYWRIKFIDNGGLESPWSSTISTDYFILSGIPTASDLQTDGMTNPTSVLKPPSFSAIYNDPNNDNSSYYQIQVNTTSNFLGTTMWDSGKKVITLSPGTRSPWIPYAGTNLNYNGTKYYVRMKFWDSDDNESSWVTGNFTDNPGRFQLEGLKLEGLKID